MNSSEQFLSGGGEMGALIRSMDWSKTPLGPIESWPQSLRTSVSLCLSSTFPILIAWGPETIQIYNDSYRPICGAMHPQSMGMNFRICWESALEVVGDKFTRGQQGEGTYIQDQQMFLQRYGYLEEAYMTFSFAPIRDESGGIGGIFHPITETTDKMLSARRTQVLRDLGAALSRAKSIEDIGRETEGKYADFMNDLPFVLFYSYDEALQQAKLVSASGTTAATQLALPIIDLERKEPGQWPLLNLLESKEPVTVEDLSQRFGDFSCEPYPEAPHTAVVQGIYISGQQLPIGFLVAGVSARRALDEVHLGFYSLLANTYNTAVSNVYAYEQEQKRAEALAEIDRSKTTFFSNVSHEFRTPLTLMLGPLEELLSHHELSDNVKDSIGATHRNALRLLKLVNNLLDYSRVEAGRVQAAFQPLDLAELTVDLASSFRSIIEKAGMQLLVNCQPIEGATYVDRQMWEKIVLNLLSNAFKYTLQGTIEVSLQQEQQAAVLRITDTGVGIPEKELPHMFERFHRVENTAGRTHEGTGIGLSLVHELISLHGGTITVASTEGKGSSFTVSVPLGKAHLPEDKVMETLKSTDSAALKGAFIKEAYSLLQDNGAIHEEHEGFVTNEVTAYQDLSQHKGTTILVVDDNGDMRNYLKRLLEPYFTIETAVNGQDALAKLGTKSMSLVLSDIMMPVMDGKAMLRHIRDNANTSRLPVIFLSARAGEESRIDGLEAGADDYLVKPFSAAELLTKIRAQIKISKTRDHAEQQLRSLLTNAPVAIGIYRGADHVVEMANQRMLNYWGRSAEETFGHPLLEVITEFGEQGFGKVMDDVYQTGERFVSEEIPIQINILGKDEISYVHVTMEALRNEDQQITGIMAVAADVTEQTTVLRQLEKANDTLKLAMEAANMGIWRTDWGTDNLMVSDIARAIHAIPKEKVLSFDETLEVIIPEHRDLFLQAIKNAVESKGHFNEDYQVQPFDGSKKKWINSTGRVELDDSGEVTGVIGTIMDITESVEDGQRKDDFIGMVSHELKTPLTTVNGYVQLLKLQAQKNKDDSSREKLDRVLAQVKKMSSLIGGFLNVSRLEAGKIHLNKKPFELTALIKEVIFDEESSTQTHQLIFEPEDEIQVIADRDKVGSAITNLISNAVKYSPKGTKVETTCVVDGESVTISVRDEGMGVKPDEQVKLFERYYRTENHQMANISGFGIGLYLSAEIIRRHHGKIWVESEPGEGSVFFIQLPLV